MPFDHDEPNEAICTLDIHIREQGRHRQIKIAAIEARQVTSLRSSKATGLLLVRSHHWPKRGKCRTAGCQMIFGPNINHHDPMSTLSPKPRSIIHRGSQTR